MSYGSSGPEASTPPSSYQHAADLVRSPESSNSTRSLLLAAASFAAVVGATAVLGTGVGAGASAASTATNQQFVATNKPVAPELASLFADGETSVDLALCGAVADVDTHEMGSANAAALQRCLEAADTVDGVGEVVVSSTYTLTPMYVTGLSDVTLRVEGELRASTNVTAWPTSGAWGRAIGDMLHFENCTGLSLLGDGVVNGRGQRWWTRASMAMLFSKAFSRPRLLQITTGEHITIKGVTFENSPYFHVYMKDVSSVRVEAVTVNVDYDVEANMALAELITNETLHGMGMSFKTVVSEVEALDLQSLSDDELTLLEDEVLALVVSYGGLHDLQDGALNFPLNTDGIDIAGTDVVVRNVTIRNFDDAVAVKSSDNRGKYSTCASNWLVEDIKVAYGLGMTIGSISPTEYEPCIENVLFRDIEFTRPFKAVYVKTGTKTTGSATVRNITWENVKISDPLWYTVYVGPQQTIFENEAHAGCTLYPFTTTDCPTNALVSISDLTLRHVHSTGGYNPIPGVLRGNASNPIRRIRFEDVSIKSRASGAYLNETAYAADEDFVCENVADSTAVDAHPVPSCF